MIKRFLFASGIIAVAGFFLWAQLFGEQWLTDFNEERQLAAETARSEGAQFGQAKTDQACLEQALTQVDQCRTATCSVDQGHFLRACWQTAQPTGNFCDEVPTYNEEITEDEKSWARYGCWDMNNKSDGCRLLMRQKQLLCETRG